MHISNEFSTRVMHITQNTSLQPPKGWLANQLQGSQHKANTEQKVENEHSTTQLQRKRSKHYTTPNLDDNGRAFRVGGACLVPIGVTTGSTVAAGIPAAII